MNSIVVVTITMTDGKVFEVEKPVDAAKSLAKQLTASGYLDPVSGQFYPPNAVLRIEIAARERLGEGWFSEN